jgi:hypothetical protein
MIAVGYSEATLCTAVRISSDMKALSGCDTMGEMVPS